MIWQPPTALSSTPASQTPFHLLNQYKPQEHPSHSSFTSVNHSSSLRWKTDLRRVMNSWRLNLDFLLQSFHWVKVGPRSRPCVGGQTMGAQMNQTSFSMSAFLRKRIWCFSEFAIHLFWVFFLPFFTQQSTVCETPNINYPDSKSVKL